MVYINSPYIMVPRYYVTLLMIVVIIHPKSAKISFTPTFLYYFCTNSTVFDPNDKFHDNLNKVFKSLTLNANNTAGFHHAEVGIGSADAVYGLFLCRGDQNTSACSDCVVTAVRDQPKKNTCPTSKEGIIWYDECMVRYSKDPIIGQMDPYPALILLNINSINASEKWFNESLSGLLRNLAKIASINNSTKDKTYYSTIKLSSQEPFYAMVQCTPDLKESDCYRCLNLGIGYLNVKQGGRALLPSCYVRYEIYPFFEGVDNNEPSNGRSRTVDTPPPPRLPPPPPLPSKSNHIRYVIAICFTVFVTIVVVLLMAKSYASRHVENNEAFRTLDIVDGDDYLIESLQFSLDVLQAATHNFCDDNKIGEGGFGRVYKGVLPTGEHIAIKKLVRNSGKEEKDFKNEMKLVAKLQHRNLVRLMGFCLVGDERLLVFEFVPNKSLDHFIFDVKKRRQLNWISRFKIIVAIARGLLYLHEDSRLTIIHRDLKPANILLDIEMNPKIADFGMARIFGMNQNFNNSDENVATHYQISDVNQSHQSTEQVGGTLGYIAPEYVETKQFSVKTDVYSFGVIVLEIVSGRKNSTFHQLGLAQDLLTYAWMQWKANKPLKMMDTTLLEESYSMEEVIRCIHLGLLCVQKDPNARPTMADIVHMLNVSSTTTINKNCALRVLQPPASYSNNSRNGVMDQDSITQLYPR